MALTKINPTVFYKYEYFSKAFKEWKSLKKSDSPELLVKYKYKLRLKKQYRYEQ
jgi:hypothetical protein